MNDNIIINETQIVIDFYLNNKFVKLEYDIGINIQLLLTIIKDKQKDQFNLIETINDIVIKCYKHYPKIMLQIIQKYSFNKNNNFLVLDRMSQYHLDSQLIYNLNLLYEEDEKFNQMDNKYIQRLTKSPYHIYILLYRILNNFLDDDFQNFKEIYRDGSGSNGKILIDICTIYIKFLKYKLNIKYCQEIFRLLYCVYNTFKYTNKKSNVYYFVLKYFEKECQQLDVQPIYLD